MFPWAEILNIPLLPWASLKTGIIYSEWRSPRETCIKQWLSMVGRFDDREALFYLKHFNSFRKEKKKKKKSLLVLMKQSLLSLNNF